MNQTLKIFAILLFATLLFQVSITYMADNISDFENFDVILAMQANGKTLRVREQILRKSIKRGLSLRQTCSSSLAHRARRFPCRSLCVLLVGWSLHMISGRGQHAA